MNTPNIETRFNYASTFDKDAIVVPIQVARDQIAALKEKHRSLETAAQGLRDGVLAMLKFVDEMNKELEGIRNVDFPAARKALARFDALKEGK